MLSTENRPVFIVTVTVNTAALQGSMRMTCVARPVSEMRVLEKQCDDAKVGVKGVLKNVITDISDVSFPAIRLAEWKTTEEAIDVLTDWPAVENAMRKAFYEGMWEEKTKN